MSKIDKLLTIQQVADVLQVGQASIYARISEEIFPRPVKLGRSNRWKTSDINKYIKSLKLAKKWRTNTKAKPATKREPKWQLN